MLFCVCFCVCVFFVCVFLCQCEVTLTLMGSLVIIGQAWMQAKSPHMCFLSAAAANIKMITVDADIAVCCVRVLYTCTLQDTPDCSTCHV